MNNFLITNIWNLYKKMLLMLREYVGCFSHQIVSFKTESNILFYAEIKKISCIL